MAAGAYELREVCSSRNFKIKMQITVFGATGQVGLEICQQALWRGHQVVAFGRNVNSMPLEHPNLKRFKGTLFDEKEVYEALQGTDVVLSVIGGALDGSDKARSLGIKNIVLQMKARTIERIIALGGLGILNYDEHTLLLDTPDYPAEYLPVGNEHRKAWEALLQSGLKWTFVCSPNIINAGPTGTYKIRNNYPPQPNSNRINAGDLAQFMLNEAERNEHLQQRVGICN